MITLDSNTYEILQTGYNHTQQKIASDEITLTGDRSRTETGVFINTFQLTLVCTITDIANLRTSYNKTATTGTPATNKLSFTDEEGVLWSPSTGSSDATHRYSTGVYFEGSLQPKPLSTKGWSAGNRFSVDITLIAIDKVL